MVISSGRVGGLLLRLLFALLSALTHVKTSQAGVGLAEIQSEAEKGPITVFYPTEAAPMDVERLGLRFSATPGAVPVEGNRRLIVISHGSPASPWVYADLAAALVAAGFVVALPEHLNDNYRNASESGPQSWRRRPAEVSMAVDSLAKDVRFSPLLDLDKVGMYGMSAGGHTALVLAGGRWSEKVLREHCDANIEEDFYACAGPTFELTGSFLDALKIFVIRKVKDWTLTDASWNAHTDARVAAIVSGVPFAADFDMESFANVNIPVAIIVAEKDRWLNPKFHSQAVLKACGQCELLADLADAGHGALLSPVPPGDRGLIGRLIGDPPEFDRPGTVLKINRLIAGYFQKQLLVRQ
ncbi:MAG: hypothetical protein KDJ73_01125 [Notoacmeibacter sp.]|nr:hypothetical protein [Notoacmeibacter sp.]